VTDVKVSKDYNWNTLENDIALITLSSPAPVDPVKVEGVTAPVFEDSALTGTRGRVIGWGRVDNQDPFAPPGVLKWAAVPFAAGASCKMPSDFDAYGPIDNRRICAGGEGGVDTCNGDSGGPLLRLENGSYTQIGITSFGSRICGQTGVFGVYTRVSSFAKFLKDNVSFAEAPLRATPVAWSSDRSIATPARMSLATPASTSTTASVASLKVWVIGNSSASITIIPGVEEAASREAADFIWNADEATVTRRQNPGLSVAEGVVDITRLAGVMAKWRTVPRIEALASAQKKISVRFDPAPADGIFHDGDRVKPVFKRPSDASLKYLTVFDLTSDGSVDFIYPFDTDGSGEWTSDSSAPVDVKAQCPFGSDHLVALATDRPMPSLHKRLRKLGDLNYPAAYSALEALNKELGDKAYAISVVPLTTAPAKE
jgi:hypothetical protein